MDSTIEPAAGRPGAADDAEVIGTGDRYSRLVDLSADAIVSVDEDYRITDFNRGAEQIFGYAAEEVLGQRIETLIPARFRTTHASHMEQFAESGVPSRRMGERREISALRKGGEEFPADASISRQDVNGRVFYTAVVRDITHQKQKERSQRFLARAGSLLASSLDVATILESMARLITDERLADCCVIFDASEASVVRRAAVAAADPDCAADLEAWRGESLAADAAHPVIHVVDSGTPLLIPDLRELFSTGAGGRDMGLMHRLGAASAIFVPLIARGRTSGAIGLYRKSESGTYGADDLSLAGELAVGAALAIDNARLYEAARRAIRARDEILAVVSHDLGNPLAAIRIGTSVVTRLLESAGVDPGATQHLGGIRKSVQQMEGLIRDLLDVERIESGPLTVGSKPIRAATVISSVMEIFNPIAAAKSVALRSRVPANVPPVRADRERLTQALSNLIGNAIKFTQSGGTVEIIAERQEEWLLVSVCDDGPGINPSDIEHIFDRFWRSARREPGAEGGLGLGLAIVKGIIEAHGGRIWAESEKGRGTRMRFTLPLSGPATRPPDPTNV